MVKPREDGIKEKVANVREVVGSGRSTNEIVMVLQYYDNNVEQTIQAFLEDGAKEALGEWNFNGKKAKTANKKKKNRNKNKDKEKPTEGATEVTTTATSPESALRDEAGATPVPELLPADGTSAMNGYASLHVNGDVSSPSISPPPSEDIKPAASVTTHSGPTKPDHKPPTRTNNQSSPPQPTKTDSPAARHHGSKPRNDHRNDHRNDNKHEASTSSVDLSSSTETSPSTSTSYHSTSKIDTSTNNPKNELSNMSRNNNSSSHKANFSGTRKDTAPIKAQHPKPKADVTSTKTDHQEPAKPSRPTSLYTGHNLLESSTGRERTLSETSNASSVGRDGKNHRLGMEKSVRDLQRQTSSLQRHKLMLNEEIERSFKNMNRYFDEIRNALNDREAELMYAMSKVKDQALDILSKRQKQSGVLKQGTERAQAMNDNDLAELRADIKMFVSDRKFDEELSQTSRFVCDHDAMMEAVRNYGQVVPIRCAYSQRRPSGSSVGSSTDGLLTPTTPSTPAHSRPTPSPLVSSTPVILSNPDRHRVESHDSEASTNGHSTSPSSTHSQEAEEKPAEPKTTDTKSNSRPADTRGQGQSQGQGDDTKKSRNSRRRKKAQEKKRQQLNQTAAGTAPGASVAPSASKDVSTTAEGATAPTHSPARPHIDNRRPTGSPRPNNRNNRNRPGPQPDRASQNTDHINSGKTASSNGPSGDRGAGGYRRQGSPNKRPQNHSNNQPRPRPGDRPVSGGGDGPKIQVNGLDHAGDSPPAATNGINGTPKKAHVSVQGSPVKDESLPQRKPRQRSDRVKRAEVVVNGNATEEELESR